MATFLQFNRCLNELNWQYDCRIHPPPTFFPKITGPEGKSTPPSRSGLVHSCAQLPGSSPFTVSFFVVFPVAWEGWIVNLGTSLKIKIIGYQLCVSFERFYAYSSQHVYFYFMSFCIKGSRLYVLFCTLPFSRSVSWRASVLLVVSLFLSLCS